MLYAPKKIAKHLLPTLKIGLLMWCFGCPLFYSSTWAQSCLPEGFVFTSQAQIDAFAIEHPGCLEILGEVVITESLPGNITNFEGFRQIQSFGNGLEIHGNQSLLNMAGLDKVEKIGGRLHIYYNQQLQQLEGLSALHQIEGSLRISSNDKLVDLKALESLHTITEDLSIASNPLLYNLKGLDSIAAVGGFLIISANLNLRNLLGLEKVTSTGKSVLIQDNPQLLELSGCNQLQRIGGSLIVENNAVLNSVHGLNELRMVGGHLIIVKNPLLFDITALIKLESIDGLLQILENPELISLSGLDNIDHQTIKDLALLSSRRLFSCQVESICDYLSIETNDAAIMWNGEGCSSREEITGACARGDGTRNGLQKSEFLFYPNPTYGEVQALGPGASSAELRIIDPLGRTLLSQKMESDRIDLRRFPAGVYMLELTTKSQVVVGQVVKLSN